MSSTITIVEYASARVELRRISGEWVGPCPMCGGTDRFHIFKDGTGWICRKCRPQSGGVADLISLCENISIGDALKKTRDEHAPIQRRAPEKKAPKSSNQDWRSETWQLKARTIVTKAAAAYAGSLAEDYMAGRKITRETAAAFKIGFDPSWPTKFEHEGDRVIVIERKPVVVIPWIMPSGEVSAIKVRIINAAGDDRFRQMRGGSQVIFGLHAGKQSDVAVAVEGEINAMSVRQSLEGPDVFSIGGETNYRTLAELVPLYKRVLVWMDDPAKAKFMHEKINRPTARYIVSPGGMDANDILINMGAGALAHIIKERLS